MASRTYKILRSSCCSWDFSNRMCSRENTKYARRGYLTLRRSQITHADTSSAVPTVSLQPRRRYSMCDLDKDQKGRERVVVLGSGWGGYTMARALDHKKYQVVIVSPRSYFVFTPLLASTSVGTLEFRTALEPIRSRSNKAAYFQAWADNVSFHDKTVTIEEAVFDPRQGLAPVTPRFEGMTDQAVETHVAEKYAKGGVFTLKYDKLVISVGSYSQTFNTPGVKEHANFLKDVGDSRQIRKRILECFEAASLPTTPDEIRRQILRIAIVGGGPTGMEFSAELFDFIHEDLSKLYPELTKFCSVQVYDVASKVLQGFDEKLATYATEAFKREGIEVKTSRQIESLSAGLPGQKDNGTAQRHGLTLSVKDEGDIGIGMCVWSTGLMMNPFIKRALSTVRKFPASEVIYKAEPADAEKANWTISRDEKTGSIFTNDRLRVILEAEDAEGKHVKAAFMKDVFAIGDCALLEGKGAALPATAQVANQKGKWLAKRLNKGDLNNSRFTYKNLGVMAYIGNRRAIVQGGDFFGDISGRTAWLIWRGAYLVKSLSWRNRILIPTYWILNALFGRDVSRF